MDTPLSPMHPALLEAVIAQAPDAIIYADRSGAIRLWNHAAERLLGHDAAAVIGASLDVIIPERFRDAHWRGFRQAVESGSARYAERVMTTKALHKSGATLYVDLSFGLIREAAGNVAGVLAVARVNAQPNHTGKS